VIGTSTTRPFEVLRARLRGESDLEAVDAPPPIARLIRVLDDGSASPRDLAVLFRHALRHEDGVLRVPATRGMPSADDWAAVGVDARHRDGGFIVEAAPWQPTWLSDVPGDGVDESAARGFVRRTAHGAPPDPYLSAFGYEQYQSAGQRASLRAVLTAPRGSTLVVSLPTGEGKSLAFHALARMGFGDGRGVTLVVTPTVALALDHENSSQELGFDDLPLAYRAREAERNAVLLERIASGEQSLCFASPEAVTTTLRKPLEEAARRGVLRAIVVDEAHLVDSWGINFRPDFQMLAGLRRRLLGLAGDRAFRTILLSATLTDGSIDVLRTLFPGTPFGVISAARLRPEIEYWVADTTNEAERERRVLEAIDHLPRPAIIYVTTRADAQQWMHRLRDLGHRRIGTVTGATPDGERQRVIDGWRDGSIDLVVGTSAFGLGIDNQHVRAVIHACIPESLDRFYQEVGRGGRDGRASLSLVVPAIRDRHVAEQLSIQRLLKEDTGAHRWEAMFTHEDHRLEDGEHVVPVSNRPGVNEREIDMVGPKNTLWNIRTLVLMAAAGGIDLLDVPSYLVSQALGSGDMTEDDDVGETPRREPPTVRVAIHDTEHRASTFWDGRIADFRKRQKRSAADSYERMLRFLEGSTCAGESIAPLYDVDAVPEVDQGGVRAGRACGGCPACRSAGRDVFEEPAPITPYPWTAEPPREPIAHLIPASGHVFVFYQTRAEGILARDREVAALRRIGASGIRNYVVSPGAAFSAEDFASDDLTVFTTAELGLDRLPPGPTLIALGASARLRDYLFNPRDPADARVWLLPSGIAHPSRRDQLLRSAPPPGRVLTLNEFVAELER
jgi:ATP-dependent DNA helicase RecQ